MERLAEVDDLLICTDSRGLAGWRVGQIGKVTSFSGDRRIIRIRPLINHSSGETRSLWRDKLNNRDNNVPQFKLM